MPIHDWTRVEVAIIHDFHHSWIGEVSRILNAGLLPNDYYALIERAACFDTRLPALEDKLDNAGDSDLEPEVTDSEGGLLPSPPTMPVADEVGLEFYRHKMDVVTIRHVNGDRIVAMVEIVSPGNKRSRNALREFVRKSAALLNKQTVPGSVPAQGMPSWAGKGRHYWSTWRLLVCFPRSSGSR